MCKLRPVVDLVGVGTQNMLVTKGPAVAVVVDYSTEGYNLVMVAVAMLLLVVVRHYRWRSC